MYCTYWYTVSTVHSTLCTDVLYQYVLCVLYLLHVQDICTVCTVCIVCTVCTYVCTYCVYCMCCVYCVYICTYCMYCTVCIVYTACTYVRMVCTVCIVCTPLMINRYDLLCHIYSLNSHLVLYSLPKGLLLMITWTPLMIHSYEV